MLISFQVLFMNCRITRIIIVKAVIHLFAVMNVPAFDPGDYEEWAGLSFEVQRNMDGDVYGFAFQSGVWLVGTPLFGEVSGGWLSNDMRDGNYSSIGFTLRIMPRTDIAPFIGAGGTYQSLLSGRSRGEDINRESSGSYWGGHVDGGLRVWFGEARHFLQALYRHTWTDSSGDLDYSLVAAAYGRMF